MRQIDTCEVARRKAVIERLFERPISQTLTLLQAVHAQHARRINRLEANSPAPWVQRLDHSDQTRPQYDTFHVGEKLLWPRALLLQRLLSAGIAPLAHGRGTAVLDALTHSRDVADATYRSAFP